MNPKLSCSFVSLSKDKQVPSMEGRSSRTMQNYERSRKITGRKYVPNPSRCGLTMLRSCIVSTNPLRAQFSKRGQKFSANTTNHACRLTDIQNVYSTCSACDILYSHFILLLLIRNLPLVSTARKTVYWISGLFCRNLLSSNCSAIPHSSIPPTRPTETSSPLSRSASPTSLAPNPPPQHRQ